MPETTAGSEATDRLAPRAVFVVDRVENAVPGRLAFVVHRGRTVGRSRSIVGLRFLEEWARRRAERFARAAAERGDRPRLPDIDLTDDASVPSYSSPSVSAPEASADARLAHEARPDESSTKGRIYELARELDLEGRSKLDKADLLEAVLNELDARPALDGPEAPVYGRRPDAVESNV